MSILNLPRKHKGELLYEELGYAGDRARVEGKQVEAVIIGHEALRLINDWLTEANGKPLTLDQVSFCGREGITILPDHRQPMRAVALAVV